MTNKQAEKALKKAISEASVDKLWKILQASLEKNKELKGDDLFQNKSLQSKIIKEIVENRGGKDFMEEYLKLWE